MIQPLKPTQIAAMLRAAAIMLEAEFAALPAELAGWHPKPDEWCIKQVLGHLIQTEETGFAGRIRFVLANDEPRLDALDQDEEAQKRSDCARDAGGLLREFVSLRRESCALVAGLSSADLQRGGWHPDIGFVRVDELLHEWVYHDRDHIQQMMKNIQAYTWENLGATQKFYLAQS